jgi:hypothetical protein
MYRLSCTDFNRYMMIAINFGILMDCLLLTAEGRRQKAGGKKRLLLDSTA